MNTAAFNFNQKTKPLWWHALDLPMLNTGAIVEGTVVAKTAKALYVDLDKYGSGTIWGSEFLNSLGIIDGLKTGDLVKAKIVSLDNENGFIELSLREADKEMGWKWIKDAFTKNETVVGRVLNANRGGLIIQVNTFQGFLPTSQMNEEHFPRVDDGDKEKILESLEKLVGQEISVKILEFNARENKIIFSEKKIDQEKMAALLEKYKIGETLSGTISRLTNFGAFLTLDADPQIKGFISISDIDWQQIERIEDVIKIGEKHEAQVISTKDGELKLSLKALKKDPWLEKIEKYKEGQTISGEVYKFMPFGALIKLEPDVFGFIHSSEFGGLEEMQKQLEIKKSYDFTIEAIKAKERRINLKLQPAE